MLPGEKTQVRDTMTGEDPEATRPSRRRNVVGAVVAVLAVAAVVLGGLRYLPVLLSGSTQTGPVPTPVVTHVPPPTSSPPAGGGDAPFTPTGFLNTLNRALADADRQAFFDHVGPGAADGLNLWWDNMAALGMSGGGLSVESGTLEGLGPGGSADLTIRLGAITLGTPRAEETTDHAAAGDYLLGPPSTRSRSRSPPGARGRSPAGPPPSRSSPGTRVRCGPPAPTTCWWWPPRPRPTCWRSTVVSWRNRQTGCCSGMPRPSVRPPWTGSPCSSPPTRTGPAPGSTPAAATRSSPDSPSRCCARARLPVWIPGSPAAPRRPGGRPWSPSGPLGWPPPRRCVPWPRTSSPTLWTSPGCRSPRSAPGWSARGGRSTPRSSGTPTARSPRLGPGGPNGSPSAWPTVGAIPPTRTSTPPVRRSSAPTPSAPACTGTPLRSVWTRSSSPAVPAAPERAWRR